ncbi:MAG TPA: gamma-glutamyltransferase, partial [Deltaproteobacteria bacterium]|nr:gamma-glutamyltransferase [Deltaproteobacteria bacterium]
GGNAVDAAVTAALILAVVEPDNSGLGGGGMALLWNQDRRKVTALDFREKAPAQAKTDMYIKPGIDPASSRIGPLAIAVPGTPAGLEWMQRRWGRLPWPSLFTEAIRYAQEGFGRDARLIQRAREKSDCLKRDTHSFRIYRPLLDPKGSGILIQEELAQSLTRLRDGGAQEFYQGNTAAQLVENLRGKGAILESGDLIAYRAVERPPLRSDFAWGTLWGMPPPTSGGVSVLRGMNILEALQKKNPGEFNGHWPAFLVRVFGILFTARNSAMGDPDFVAEMPIRTWLSKATAKKNAEEILKGEKTGSADPIAGGDHTTHLSVMDASGNAVAMTLTLNLSFGSCVTAGATGIMMNDEMDDFSVDPSSPNAFGLLQSEHNAVAPGKRPLSSMSPTLVTRNQRALLALGSPGGPRIISSVLQTLLRLYLLNEPLRAAIAAPRLHYQVMPVKIFVEKEALPLSQELERWPPNRKLPLEVQDSWGNVQAVSFTPKRGSFEAVSDPRGGGSSEIVMPLPTE